MLPKCWHSSSIMLMNAIMIQIIVTVIVVKITNSTRICCSAGTLWHALCWTIRACDKIKSVRRVPIWTTAAVVAYGVTVVFIEGGLNGLQHFIPILAYFCPVSQITLLLVFPTQMTWSYLALNLEVRCPNYI